MEVDNGLCYWQNQTTTYYIAGSMKSNAREFEIVDQGNTEVFGT